jgi:predicted nucleic acid-binding Zn ribbon protein
MLEMYKRNRFNEELVSERCGELVSLERRLQEVDVMLAQAAAVRRGPAGAQRCICGAPVLWGSHFCANCGRSVGEAPVIACVHCGTPLPAEASFCSRCGNPTGESAEAGAPASDGEPRGDTQAADARGG